MRKRILSFEEREKISKLPKAEVFGKIQTN